MSQIVQKFVTQPSPLVRSWYQSCNIQQFNRDRATPFMTAAVVRLTSIGDIVSLTWAINLEVSNGSLGIDRSETAFVSYCRRELNRVGCSLRAIDLREVPWGALVSRCLTHAHHRIHLKDFENHLPTFDVASVKLFNVVDFPLDGYVPLHG